LLDLRIVPFRGAYDCFNHRILVILSDDALNLMKRQIREAIRIKPTSLDSHLGLAHCRTNAVRFFVNALRAHPIPSLIHAFPAKTLWVRSVSLLSSCPCEVPLSRSEVTGMAQLQLLIFWRQFSGKSFQDGERATDKNGTLGELRSEPDNSEPPMLPKQFEHWVFRVTTQAKEKLVIGSEDAFSVVAPI
jgi:hypothetical protein